MRARRAAGRWARVSIEADLARELGRLSDRDRALRVRVWLGWAGAGGSVSRGPAWSYPGGAWSYPGARGRTRGRAVVRGGARSYVGARGRTWGRVVVPGGARSYLRASLRYDRVELRTTACGRDTTARFYVRPGGTAYDRAGPMAHGDEPVCAPGRSGLRRPASRRSAGRGCGACGMQQDSCRCAYPLAARGERPGLGSFGRGVPEPVAKEPSAGIEGRGKPVIPTISPVRSDWIRYPGHRAEGRLAGGGT